MKTVIQSVWCPGNISSVILIKNITFYLVYTKSVIARVGVNSIPELELQLNSNSNSGIGIGIEIGGIENGIGIPGIGIGIGIENRNWIFWQLLLQQLLVNQPFPNFSFSRGGHNLSYDWLFMQQVFLGHCPPVVWSQKIHGQGTLFPLSGQRP